MQLACHDFQPKVVNYQKRLQESSRIIKGTTSVSEGKKEEAEVVAQNAEKVLKVIKLMEPILEIHRDMILATINTFHQREDDLDFLQIASCLLETFDKNLQRMKEAYKIYVPLCIEAKEIVTARRKEVFEPMRLDLAKDKGVEDVKGRQRG